MKKFISLILTILMLCSVFSGLSITANGAIKYITSDDGNYVYYILDADSICLNGFSEDYSGDTTNIEIPSVIDGYTVTVLDDYCFNFEACESVLLPDTLATIGTGAFASCSKLKEITIPASVEYIYENAFFNCTNMTKMVVHGELSYVGEHSIGYCQYIDNNGNPIFKAIEGFTVYGNSGKLASYASKYGVNHEEIKYSINIEQMPYKTVYLPGEEADWTGLVLSEGLNYEEPTIITDYALHGFNSHISGTQTITVSYMDNYTTFEITVLPTEINLDKDSETIYVSGTTKLIPEIIHGLGETTFTSLAPEIATVDNVGNITALRAGTVDIIVANNGETATYTLTVENPSIDTIERDMFTNETHQLTITGQLGEALFETSDETVATVDENGLITAVGAGDTVITVKTNGVELTCNITVKATTIALAETSATVYATDTAQVVATVENGLGDTTYTSDNTDVATVDENGLVTTKKAGTAIITVTNNDATAAFEITVKNPTLNKNSANLVVGKTLTLKINGQIGTAKFKTSNKKLATVNAKGVVTAKKEGTVTITAETNGITLSCKVTVKGNPKISKKKANLEMGDSLTLKITGTGQKAKWSTSNKKIATVSNKGKVTAKKAGKATITAKVGNKKLTCKVTVKVPTPKISVFISGEPDFSQFIVLSVENMGKLKLTVKSSGILVNNGVDTYQNLYLTDEKGKKINKVDIKAGEDKSVVFAYNDRGHYYDEDTYVWFNFEYAGVLYQAQVRHSSLFGMNKCYKIVKLG